jgi:hypothetical protein
MTCKAGKKSTLVAALVRDDKKSETEGITMRKLRQFLKDTGKVEDNEMPPVNLHYKDTAKLVDTFNSILGRIVYPHRCDRDQIALLMHCLKLTVVNAWVLWCDLNNYHKTEDNEADIIKFIEEVSAGLLAK